MAEPPILERQNRICILNSYEIQQNYGGPIGVFRESFLKLSGLKWEVRSFSEVNPRDALPSKALHRAFGPAQKGYDRASSLHKQIAHYAAMFSQLPGVRNYGAVWFSDLVQYVACRPLLAPNQRAVLQLHHPALPSIEALEQPWLNATDLSLLKRAERWALEDADVVVLANKGAEQIYGDLLAGSTVMHLQNAMAVRDPGEIPILSRDHTNFVFVGRRNSLKGYDLLMAAFAQAHAQEPSLRLYLIGGGDPVSADGVVDLGFSTVPAKWLAAASCVLIPNRSSYLDLNLLEALSIDVPVMMTCTEGHESFAGASPSIYRIEEASIEAIKTALLDAPRWLRDVRPGENLALFEKRYGLDRFAQTLNEVASEILMRGPKTSRSRLSSVK